jgi:HSP20 family protein
MKLEKRKPVQPARSLNTWVEDFFNRDFLNFFGNESWAATPSVNVKEDESRFFLELAAPGLKREDFKIEVDNQVLSLSSERKEEKTEEEENYRRREFNYTSFQRTFQLPEEVDIDKITANYQDGVLLVTLPKKEEAVTNKKRKIEIH